MKTTISLIIVVLVIPTLLVVVWLADPSTHPIVLSSSAAGVFVALGIFRAIRPKPRVEIASSEQNKRQVHRLRVILTTVIGPLTAGILSIFFPKMFAPIVVTVMCLVSFCSLLLKDRI